MISRFLFPTLCISAILLTFTMAEKQTPTDVQKQTEPQAHIPGSNMIGAGRRAHMNRNKGHTPVTGHGQNDATDSPRVISGRDAILPENQKHLSDGNIKNSQ